MSPHNDSHPSTFHFVSWLKSTSFLNAIRVALGSTLLYSPTTVPGILGGFAHNILATMAYPAAC